MREHHTRASHGPDRSARQKSLHRHRMLLCQRIKRQLRFLIGQGKADDDVLTPELAPESLRRPFLRLRAARSFDPDEGPLRHESVPRKNLKTWKSEGLEI